MKVTTGHHICPSAWTHSNIKDRETWDCLANSGFVWGKQQPYQYVYQCDSCSNTAWVCLGSHRPFGQWKSMEGLKTSTIIHPVWRSESHNFRTRIRGTIKRPLTGYLLDAGHWAAETKHPPSADRNDAGVEMRRSFCLLLSQINNQQVWTFQWIQLIVNKLLFSSVGARLSSNIDPKSGTIQGSGLPKSPTSAAVSLIISPNITVIKFAF